MNKHKTYKDIMSGVSQMIPFVVAGGILIALSFIFDASNRGEDTYGFGNAFAAFFHDTGSVIFTFILPILAGYIAFAIADRPGLVPGFLAGALAYTKDSGFLGALLGGLAAGYLMILIKKILQKLPRSMNGLKSILIFPLLGSMLIALIMFPINYVVSPISLFFQTFLDSMSESSAIIVGLIAGAMMAVDLGGPVNKAAYIVGVASISGGTSSILMASIMAAGMIPPLGIALATLIFKNKFTEEERDAGKANWMMGISFITEGAIPFAAGNPKIYLPILISGSAIAGALVGLFQTSVPAPHGGLFVVLIMQNWWGFLIALVSGMIVTALLLKVFLPNPELEKQ